MAQIELRHATIRLVDGYANTALVNDTPANGDLVVDIDTLGTSDIISVGTRFTVVGSSLTHYVTDENSNEQQLVTVDATAGNFTLGFTGTVANPIAEQTTANIAEGATAAAVQSALEALAAIAPGDVVVTGSAGGPWTIEFTGTYAKQNIGLLNGVDVDLTGGGDTITVTTPKPGGITWRINFTPAFATGTGVPADNAAITFSGHTLEAKLGEGNLSYTENREMEYVLDRQSLDTVREGDDQPMDVSLDFVWEFITAQTTDDVPTFEDALKQRGLAADWVSSATADPCAPYAVDIEIEYDPPCGAEQREIILLPDFRWDSLEHNADEGQISLTGRCNAKEAVVSRAD
jgi:hypothetical protein